MKKHASRTIIAGLLIAWLVDFLFYKKAAGIAFPIWVFISILIVFILARNENIKPAKLSYLLAALAVGLSSVSFFRLEPFTRFMGMTGALLLSILLVITFRNGFWFWYRFVDYLHQGLLYLGGVFINAGKLFFKSKETSSKESIEGEPESTENKHSNRRVIFAVLRGLVFALPIVLVLAALLASADPIFKESLAGIFDIFKIENLPEYTFRLFYILVLAYAFTSSILYALYNNSHKGKPNPGKAWMKPFLGNIETTVVFASIVALFGAFVIIQFRYFFGGTENINIEGYTFAEYARKGFGELVMVAVLSIAIYLTFHTITKKQENANKRLFSFLSVLIFAEVLVILVSSYYRLDLYESAYGFSRLRTYSHLFIPWLAVLILGIIVLELFKKQGRFGLLLFTFSIGFTATMMISNIDGFIAQQNINRAQLSSREGYRLDHYYLLDLSNDAVPVLFDEYQHNTGEVKDRIGVNLACRYIEVTRKDNNDHWQSFNLSQNRAEKILLENETLWAIYEPKGAENTVTLNGEEFYCYDRYYWD